VASIINVQPHSQGIAGAKRNRSSQDRERSWSNHPEGGRQRDDCEGHPEGKAKIRLEAQATHKSPRKAEIQAPPIEAKVKAIQVEAQQIQDQIETQQTQIKAPQIQTQDQETHSTQIQAQDQETH
jgi:hypothetical protein